MNMCVFVLAGNTAREIIRQSIFYLIIGGGAGLILFSFSFTLFAFGEETRMIKEMGISTITVCALCLASLSATSTISFEIVIIVLLTFAILGVLLTVSAWLKEAIGNHTSLSESFWCLVFNGLAALRIIFANRYDVRNRYCERSLVADDIKS